VVGDEDVQQSVAVEVADGGIAGHHRTGIAVEDSGRGLGEAAQPVAGKDGKRRRPVLVLELACSEDVRISVLVDVPKTKPAARIPGPVKIHPTRKPSLRETTT
jgi:hypothetical protein